MVKTKIVATLGPSSSSETVLRKMFQNGLDVVRLNFSHGSHSEHLERVELVRRLNKKMQRAIKIMQDLEGYRIRIGELEKDFILRRRSTVYLTQEHIVGNERQLPFDYRGSLRPIKKGTFIYIDDGKIVLQVKETGKNSLKTQVRTGGILKQHKGINIPGVKLEFDAFTQKDRKDINIAIQHKLDYVAQSFVRNADDLRILKNIVKPVHSQCCIFAKIENEEALGNIEEIVREADGIIVARGDLGICLPIYKVPVIQKEIVKISVEVGKPVIVATQMLDSMTLEPLPTRAEVSDVANAILDGATHLLLSGETAIGKHPHRVVAMMNKVIRNTENYQKKYLEARPVSGCCRD